MKHDVEIPPHLKKTDPGELLIKRKKWGKGFRYVREDETAISDEEQLNLLKSIPVPNTWTEVRLSHEAHSHILAVGYDGSDKLQYLYHPDFLEYRNQQKFERLYDFGQSLPRIRRRLRKDLKLPEWNEQKLLALIVRILDKYHLRIGSRVYARQNDSFGLTTLRKKHLKEVDSNLMFQYTGKSGQNREVQLSDPHLVELIEEIADFSGWELFSFQKNGVKVAASGTKVNQYIREIAGEDFSARNFRTWAGTVLTVKYRKKAQRIVEQNPRRKLRSTLVDLVSEKLGNTHSICENYYIHPKVLAEAEKENFDPHPCDERFLKNTLYRKHECRTLEILAGG